MEFGVSFLPDVVPNQKSAQDYFKEAFLLSEQAESLGFSYVKMTEHYLHPYGGYCPSPLLFLSQVAVKTTKIRLMTGCLLPVFHHPVSLAAETALLDVLSGGRLEVGFARAYLPHEFKAFGISMDESRLRFSETIQAVLHLWQSETVNFQSSLFSLEQGVSLPKPLQSPHPPLWGAAVNARQSFAWLGEQQFNLLVTPPMADLFSLKDKLDIYRESFFSRSVEMQSIASHDPFSPVETRCITSHDPSSPVETRFIASHDRFSSSRRINQDKKPKIAISLPLCLAETEKEANELSDIYLKKYLEVWTNATLAWSGLSSTDYPGYTDMAAVLKQNSPEKMRENRQALVGTPERILENILAIKEILGIEIILWQLDYGGLPYSFSKKMLDLFAEKIQSRL